MDDRKIKHTLDLSESRAYDAPLEILGTYKLTDNFYVRPQGTGRRRQGHVRDRNRCPSCLITRAADMSCSGPASIFTWTGERSVKARIGFDATLPWWKNCFAGPARPH